ncbi:hypothetical protein INN71_01695 [Nocardioides sp. ChNu-153]|uniref:hypothetical protein n=1 Tax=unclassified Nocardioides TaxID=2615069 RepID=UPI0024061641|nr:MULTISPECIES: hypothetical protein [unclassified Nocardioides]MDF9714775.1 hypothetical protein [Nocardioides sp. ChNu-99]MDN7120099.1 hypothetical protein [Nocardioides sp. ChNu-153]
MLLLVRAGQAEVAETLDRARVEGSVAPTGAGGWTLAWCDHGALDLFAARTDVVGFWDVSEERDPDEAGSAGRRSRRRRGDGGDQGEDFEASLVAVVAGPAGRATYRTDGERTAGDLRAVAEALTALFGVRAKPPVRPTPVPLTPREEKRIARWEARRARRHPQPPAPDPRTDPTGAVAAAFGRSHGWVDELVEALEELLELPALESAPIERVVVLRRGDEQGARMGARIAANITGPVRITPLGEGWQALEPTTTTEVDELFTALAGVVAAAGPRRTPVLALWRDADGSCGVDVAHGDRAFARSSWGTGWREVGPRDTGTADDVAAFLAHQVAGEGAHDLDMVALRALMRADERRGDPLVELVELLGLPPEGLAILDRTVAPDPDAEVVTAAGFWRTWSEGVRDDAGYEPFFARPVRVAGAWLSVVGALLLLLLAVVMVGTVVTDGAFVDEEGVSTVDWAFAALSVVLFLSPRW